MATQKNLRPREPRPLQLLRQAARAAGGLPVAGDAMRRFQNAESWALIELKQRLSEVDPVAGSTGDGQAAPADMLAQLLEQSRDVDQGMARDRLYRHTLSQLVPDQAAMFALLADRGRAPLCHVVAGRLLTGTAGTVVLANASTLGRDAGVLLRERVPQYMSAMLQMGLLETGPEDRTLAAQYELLQADTRVRHTMDRIRTELKMHPRLQRFSVTLSDFGQALWRDCQPDGQLASGNVDRRSTVNE